MSSLDNHTEKKLENSRLITWTTLLLLAILGSLVILKAKYLDEKAETEEIHAKIVELSHSQVMSRKFHLVSQAAKGLPKTGQLFCWVSTTPIYHDIRVPAVHETWLPRCDHGQFFTAEPIEGREDIPFTTVFRSMNDTYDMLFYKTIKAFHFAYTQISDKFEWYLKADDDSYIFVDHLKQYLSTFNSSEPLYLGYVWPTHLRNGYNSGGGYLLSNAAVKIFVEELYGNRTACPFNIAEDLGMGWCLEQKGIRPADTRDGAGKLRFFYDSIKASRLGHWALSSDIAMVHYNSPDEIRMIDYIYFNINDPLKE